ncbi:MAG: hypothetical protein K2J04_01375, partial [Lachnospiraceae bacterium]|nr:hypothetical protein [Lachnospiraceae bacterium]
MKKISKNSGRSKIDGLEKYSLRRKKRTIWTAAGCVLTALMVVGISFALRGQGRALTAEQTLACSYTEHVHQHSDGCWTDGVLSCGMADYVVHHHDKDYCYDENGNLVCTLDEHSEEAHTHTPDNNCYDADGKLTCVQLETYAHQHDANCLQIVQPSDTPETGTTGSDKKDETATDQENQEPENPEKPNPDQENKEPE